MRNGRDVVVMSSNENIVLLDSNVIAGVLAVGKDGSTSKKTESNLAEWGRAINELVSKIDSTLPIQLKVPTPICYELMAWDKKWFDIVNDPKYVSYFYYASYHLKNEFLRIGAKYAYESQIRTGSDGQSAKLKTMDPLLAAYSIKFGYPILTENECDFPDSHFEVVGMELIKLVGSDKSPRKHRSVLYLLKPKEEVRQRLLSQ